MVNPNDPTQGVADPAGQAPVIQPPAAPAAPPAQPSADPQAPPPSDPEPFDRERAMATIARQREAEAQAKKEAADARRAAAALQAELQQFKDAQLSEAERRDKRLAELEAKQSDWERERQELTTRQAVTAAATRLRFIDPDDAYRALNHSQIVPDADGNPTNVDELLAALAKAKPYLLAAPASSGATANPAGGHAQGTSEADALYAQISGGGHNFWDEAYARAQGGGVFVVKKD